MFSVCVAGHNATNTSNSIYKFFLDKPDNLSPFNYIRGLLHRNKFIDKMKESGLGTYNKIQKCMMEVVNKDIINLKKITIEELEKFHGIGPKTARFFVMHSRPNIRCAALDVHILKFLRLRGIDAPKSTPPSGKKYSKLEKIFLKEADDVGLTPSELDILIWRLGATNKLEGWVVENYAERV